MRSSERDKPNKSSGGSAQVLKYIWSQFGKIYPQTFSQEPPLYLARKLNDIGYIPVPYYIHNIYILDIYVDFLHSLPLNLRKTDRKSSITSQKKSGKPSRNLKMINL